MDVGQVRAAPAGPLEEPEAVAGRLPRVSARTHFRAVGDR